MGWRRLDRGVLGAPAVHLEPRVSYGLIALIALLGLYLPLFGLSYIAVLLTERFLLRRSVRISRWLGLAD